MIESEIEHSGTFFNSNRVVVPFTEYDYLALEPIFLENQLIDRILNVLIEVMKSCGLDKKFTYLVLADFLFSFKSFGIINLTNVYFHVNRSDYIQRISLRGSINVYFGINYCEYIILHKKLLIGMVLKNILKKTIVRTIENNSWSTNITFRLETGEITNFLVNTGISYNGFQILDVHGSKYSFGSFRNVWKVRRKKKEMRAIDIDYSSVEISSNLEFTLSRTKYELCLVHIEEEELKLLHSLNCENIDEFNKKMLQIIKDEKLIRKLTHDFEFLKSTKHRDLVSLRLDIHDEYNAFLETGQKLLSIQLLKDPFIFDKKMFLPCFMDNRGRQYYGSWISPTFYKIFRNLYDFGANIEEFVNLEKSIYFKKIIEHSKKISFPENFNSLQKYLSTVYYIEAGKHFIKGKYGYMISTHDIILEGINAYENKLFVGDCEDDMYLENIYSALLKIYTCTNIRGWLIPVFKDATASGLQNFGILLKYRLDKIHFLNLNGENWCDTYSYLIDKFLVDKTYSKREYWKSTIMTIPYNAAWYTCFIKFLNALKKDGIIYSALDKKEKEKIRKIHRNFYNKIKNDVKSEFFENKNSDKLKKFYYDEWIVVNKWDYKINYSGGRDKYTSVLYVLMFDEKTTNRGLEANNMHYLDAKLVKYLTWKYDIMPIHDCFGINVCNLHNFMDDVNKYYSSYIGKNKYSIHILI